MISIKGRSASRAPCGSIGKMTNYVRGQIEGSRRAPRDGLISELVRAEEDGDKARRASSCLVLLLLIAGFETTTRLIEDSVIALEQNPEQGVPLRRPGGVA